MFRTEIAFVYSGIGASVLPSPMFCAEVFILENFSVAVRSRALGET